MTKIPAPYVSIGIPTCNRINNLAETIASVLNQDYQFLEIVISDNASTDKTEDFCKDLCSRDERVVYNRQKRNIGPTNNFKAVLEKATGDYFMWLGDDDKLDSNYISECLKELEKNDDCTLVSGTSKYYLNNTEKNVDAQINLLSNNPYKRVIRYYSSVSGNGVFYGLYKRKALDSFQIKNKLGNDWLLISNIAFLGKIKTVNTTFVHRKLGGSTAGFKDIVTALGLPGIQAVFPHFIIAGHAFNEVLRESFVYQNTSKEKRFLLACSVFMTIIYYKVIKVNARGVMKLLTGNK